MMQRHNVIDCYNKTASEYAAKFFRELDNKPLDRMMLIRLIEDVKDGPVADLGCGPGHTTNFIYENGLTDIVGIDISDGMISTAKQLLPHIKFETGNMMALNYDNNTFSAVTAFYAIVHLNDKELEQTIREIFRVLKPEGRFLFCFHHGDENIHLEEFLDKDVDITFKFFDTDKVLEMTEQAGFRIIDAYIRYPYNEEHQSRRAYIYLIK